MSIMKLAPSTKGSFVSARCAAMRLGVPVNWLRAQADAGRLPHLRIGRRLLFPVEAVEAELLSRSMGAVKGEAVPV